MSAPEAEKPAEVSKQEASASSQTSPPTTSLPQQAQAAEKKPTVEELLALMQTQLIAFQAENKKSIDLIASQNAKSVDIMAQAIVKLNEKIEAKGSNPKGEGTSDWIGVLRELTGAGKPSSLEEAARNVESLTKFAEAMDRFRHPFDFEGTLAKRLLWRHGLRAGAGIPRYMTKVEMKRYDKLLDQSLGLGEEEGEGEEEHVRASE